VLAASLAFSAASTYYFSVQVRQEAHSRFETVAIGVANDVHSRIRAYGDVLYALRGLFDSSDEVTERPEYAVLTYIEPMSKNVVAWGLDLNADPRGLADRAAQEPCRSCGVPRNRA
jgi:CHASE1-domain containing sensor protein